MGVGKVEEEKINNENPYFEGDVKIEQTVEGSLICLGICNIRVTRKVEYEEIVPQPKKIGISRVSD